MSVRIRGLCKTVFLHRQLEAEWGGAGYSLALPSMVALSSLINVSVRFPLLFLVSALSLCTSIIREHVDYDIGESLACLLGGHRVTDTTCF